MHFVYVLFSHRDKKLYVGYTTDLDERLKRHSAGNVIATQNRLPLEHIYHECYQSSVEAKRREKYLKGGNGREQLKIQLFETLQRLGYLFRY
jgi:putative endonuclease